MYTIAVGCGLTALVAGIISMKFILIPYGLVLLSRCKQKLRVDSMREKGSPVQEYCEDCREMH